MAFLVNNSVIRAACVASGLGKPPSGVLHIWGARGALPWSGAPNHLSLSAGNALDEWNDTIGVFGTAFGLWTGTVDPGLYYTQHPTNPGGCAHLENGVWSYKLGAHKGHEALVQAAPVTVIRDADKDGTGEQGERRETGYFGINIHAGEGSHVGEWSAGCQVVYSDNGWSGPQWTQFLHAVKAAGQATYRYYLLDGEQLADAAVA